jgi:hypothetical protein
MFANPDIYFIIMEVSVIQGGGVKMATVLVLPPSAASHAKP